MVRSVPGHAAWLGGLAAVWLCLMFLGRIDATQAFLTSRMLWAVGLTATYLTLWVWRARASGQSRDTLLHAILVTTSILATVGALETLAAIGAVHWGRVFRLARTRGAESHYMTSFEQDAGGWFQRIPGSRWTTRPQSDLESRWGLPASAPEPITFTYDARGYRNLRDLNEAEVALIGDSYVEGAYVSDHETVARRLEAKLARPVANLGVAGYGPSFELRVLTRDAGPLDPSIVAWFVFEGNDLYDSDFVPVDTLAPSAPATATPSALRQVRSFLREPRRRRERSFTYNAFWTLSNIGHAVIPNRIPDYGVLSRAGEAPERIYFGDYGSVPWTAYEEQRWQEVSAFVLEGAQFAAAHHIHLLIFLVPTKFRIYRPLVDFPRGSKLRAWTISPFPERFADFCRSNELECLDLTEPLRRSVHGGWTPYAKMDTHWGPDGHEIVASLLAEEITRRGWLP
jgi:hypothetical protein